ncbi:MAG: type II toxin-antitoxin system VapC family toxin [Deltaproteobacteria bacterium]|jgi:PIN domain nuclease of toxin-antitoxin system|nr:type II toxin-antitoxin system VapC family toxin [Deltaproteobacteria bacterium]
MIVVDTHILIWMYLATEKLSEAAIKAISEADFLLIPSISLWEVSMLVNYRRLELPCSLSDWLNTVCNQPKVKLQEITPAIAVLSGSIDMHGDPADRIIVATAKTLSLPLVTADHRIRNLSQLSCLW